MTNTPQMPPPSSAVSEEIEALGRECESFQPVIQTVFDEVKRILVGQDDMLLKLIIGLLCRGHILLEGVPGLAKTLLVQTVADALGVPVGTVHSRVHRALDAMRAGVLTAEEFPPAMTERFGPPTSSAWIGGMIDAVIEGSLAAGEVRMTDEVLADMNELRDFMFERVYLSPAQRAPQEQHKDGDRGRADHRRRGPRRSGRADRPSHRDDLRFRGGVRLPGRCDHLWPGTGPGDGPALPDQPVRGDAFFPRPGVGTALEDLLA